MIGQRVGLSAGDIDGVSPPVRPDAGHDNDFVTNPEGRDVEVDGMMFTTPQKFDWLPGTSHTIGVPSTQGDDTERFRFAKWSDGRGSGTHRRGIFGDNGLYGSFHPGVPGGNGAGRPPAGGTVTIEPMSDDGFYVARTPIEVTAVPAEGYAFGHMVGRFAGRNTTGSRETRRGCPVSLTI